MIIYRLEDKQGLGVKGDRFDRDYWSLDRVLANAYEDRTKSSHMREECRPLPWQDGIPKSFIHRRDWLFGFAEIFDLLRWFSQHDLLLMGLLGAHVVEYEVCDCNVWRGRSQVVFHASSAKRVNEKNAREYSLIKHCEGDWLDREYFDRIAMLIHQHGHRIGSKIDADPLYNWRQ
jgi:hypothetical protein